KRIAWIHNAGGKEVRFTFETDRQGNGTWSELKSVTVPAAGSLMVDFSDRDQGEWIRVLTNSATTATVHFYYDDEEKRGTSSDRMFDGLAPVTSANVTGGLLYGLGNDRRALGILGMTFNGTEKTEVGYYEMGADMKLVPKEDVETANFIREKFAIPENVVTVDESSVLIKDDKGRRWRLPLGDQAYTDLTN